MLMAEEYAKEEEEEDVEMRLCLGRRTLAWRYR